MRLHVRLPNYNILSQVTDSDMEYKSEACLQSFPPALRPFTFESLQRCWTVSALSPLPSLFVTDNILFAAHFHDFTNTAPQR